MALALDKRIKGNLTVMTITSIVAVLLQGGLVKCDSNDLASYATTLYFNETVKKCCPEAEGIGRFRESQNESYVYSCTEPLKNNTTSSVNGSFEKPLLPLKAAQSGTRFVYGFPEILADGLFELPFVSEIAVPDDYCIDRILAEQTNDSEVSVGDGTLVVLTGEISPPSASGTSFSLRTVAKCCVGEAIYDMETHSCAAVAPSAGYGSGRKAKRLGIFEEFVGGETSLLSVRYGLPPCFNPSVVYEYSGDDYEFELKDDELTLARYGGRKESLAPGSFCLEEAAGGALIARACRPGCAGGPCVTKCCPEGQVYMYTNSSCKGRAICTDNPRWGFTPTFYDTRDRSRPIPVEPPATVGIKYRELCQRSKYILMPDVKADQYFLDSASGSLLVPALPRPLQPDYCLEILDATCGWLPPGFYAFVCFPVVPDPVRTNRRLQTFSVGLVISCVFLASTLVVYLALPALQNLHGRTLMAQVAAMLVAYSCLARVQWSEVPKSYCKGLGYAVYFSFLTAFSWLNIMCFDIWWTFGNIRSVQCMRRGKDRKKFFLFSLYCLGIPLVLTATTYCLDDYDILPGYLDANIGESQCWFSTSTVAAPVLILFILPIGLQIGTNLILFILTAVHCSKVKSEIHRMQAGSMGDRCKRRFLADKAKYAMNIKLFIVMGISWVTEIISSVCTEPAELWYLADFLNVMQGIPIFCILVLKRKVYRLIRKRLGLDKNTDRRRSDAVGGMTTTTGISTSCVDPLAKKNINKNISSSSLMVPGQNRKSLS